MLQHHRPHIDLELDIKLGYGNQQSKAVVFLDILKAYNSSFWSQDLLYKAANLGITGLILSWIKDFIKGRTMCVRVGDKLSQQSQDEWRQRDAYRLFHPNPSQQNLASMPTMSPSKR